MPQGIFTRKKRFTFVEKSVSEVGDFTDYPIEVTGATNDLKLDKIAEIYLRAKVAQITVNELWDGVYGGSSGVGSGLISPRVQGVVGSGLGEEQMMHGYWTLDSETYPCHADSLSYLDNAYSVTFVSLPSAGYTSDFRDVSDKEAGIYLSKKEGFFPIWNEVIPSFNGLHTFYDVFTGVSNIFGADEQNFRTAFSWYSQSDYGTENPPTMPIPYISQFNGGIVYEQMEVMVEWSGEIAVVKPDPANADYGSGNQYFLGVRVRIRTNASEEATTNDIGSLSSTSARYVIRLSTGDLSCLLASSDATLVGDFVHEVTEWWPYQDGGGNVWNPTTGLPA